MRDVRDSWHPRTDIEGADRIHRGEIVKANTRPGLQGLHPVETGSGESYIIQASRPALVHGGARELGVLELAAMRGAGVVGVGNRPFAVVTQRGELLYVGVRLEVRRQPGQQPRQRRASPEAPSWTFWVLKRCLLENWRSLTRSMASSSVRGKGPCALKRHLLTPPA